MKPQPRTLFAFIALILAVNLACAGLGTPPIATEEPTNTPLPTKTATPKSTSTPKPTATQIRPTPTPAQVGDVVTDDLYEVTILYARKLGSVFLDSDTHWEANPGYLFLELGVKIKNLKAGSRASSPWKNIYVIDENGDGWYPGWAAYRAVKAGVRINPKELIFAEMTTSSANELVIFEEDAYIRVIWTIKDNNPSTVLFGFDSSPLIQVVID